MAHITEIEAIAIALEKEFSVTESKVLPNGLVKIVFNDGQTNYFHPDALVDLADDNSDTDGVVYPDDMLDDDDDINDDKTDLKTDELEEEDD